MCISELLRALCARKIHNNYDDMNYSKLIAAIDDRIRANGRREITGQTLHDVLEAMVRSLGAGYQVAGVLGPDDDPGEPDQRFAWLASEAGVYRHCGGVSVTELSWLVWGGGQWLVKPLDVPFGASVREWIADAVAEERSRALIAEALLQQGLDKEVSDRTEAVAAEVRERKAADAEEQARAERAEQANAAAIAKETEDRKAADAALQAAIDALPPAAIMLTYDLDAQELFGGTMAEVAAALEKGAEVSVKIQNADAEFASPTSVLRVVGYSYTAPDGPLLLHAVSPRYDAAADVQTNFNSVVFQWEAGGNVALYRFTPQAALVSGTNIKTVNGESLLGSGDLAIREGLPTIKAGEGQFSEIFNFSDSPYYVTRAIGMKSHAEGSGTVAGGAFSHAEGSSTGAHGEACHAEGEQSRCGGTASHAEGYNNKSNNYNSDAPGDRQGMHIEGAHNTVYVNMDGAHIEGAFHKGIKGRGLGYFAGCHIGGSCYLDQRFDSAVINRIIGAGTDKIPKNAFALVARNYGGHSGATEPTSLFYFQGIGGYTGKEDNVGDDVKDLATVISELESAGGGGGPFALTLTLGTGDKWSMDCTFAELAAAVDAKRGVIFTMSGGSYDGDAFTATLLLHSSAGNVVVMQGYVNKAYIYVVVTNGSTGLTVDVSEVNLVNIDTNIPAAPSNENVPGTKAVKDYVDGKCTPCVIGVDSIPGQGVATPYVVKSGELSPYRVIVLACDSPDGYREVNVFGLWIGNSSVYYGFAMSAAGAMVKIAFNTSISSLSTDGDL